MGRRKFALSICLILSVVIGFSGLSSCGGGGGPSRSGDQVIITPPGNRAPVSTATFENIALTLEVGRPFRWGSDNLGNYFSDPDGDRLSYSAMSSDRSVAAATVSEPGPVAIVQAEGGGSATITVTAADPGGLTASQSFTVMVTDKTSPPTDHSDTPAGATVIALDAPFTGRIDSPTDVDYFRLRIDTPGTLTIQTTGSADPDIAVFDAAGVEVPGISGSWIGDITQDILGYLLVRFSGGNPGQTYTLRSVLEPSLPPANKAPKPVPNTPLGPITLTLTEGEETLTCDDTYGICRVVTEPSLKKAVILQGDLNNFFYDPEGESLRFQVTCPRCFGGSRDGTVEITPPAARTPTGHPSPAIKIFPEIGDDSLEFHVTAIDPLGARGSQTLELNVIVNRSWRFDELDVSLSYDLGDTLSEQTNNTIDLGNYITPTNPDVTFQVSPSGDRLVSGLSWTLPSEADGDGRTYLEIAATDRAEPGSYNFTVTASHPNGSTRQRSLTVEIIAAEETPGTCVAMSVIEQETERCHSGREFVAEATNNCGRDYTIALRWNFADVPEIGMHARISARTKSIFRTCYNQFFGRPDVQYCITERITSLPGSLLPCDPK